MADQSPAGAAQAAPADPARLRAGLEKLADEMTREAASYYAAHEHLAGSDHQASVSAHVRWQMATDAAHRLRALLEET